MKRQQRETATNVYVTYIETTPEKLWRAITDPEMTRRYWRHPGSEVGNENVSDWKVGSPWEHRGEGKLYLIGKVIESVRPRRLVLTWAFPAEADDENKVSRVTFDIEPQEKAVRLTVTHEDLVPGSDMLSGISRGWPAVLSGLKTFLETGRPLALTRF